jgi:hypothetical protein
MRCSWTSLSKWAFVPLLAALASCAPRNPAATQGTYIVANPEPAAPASVGLPPTEGEWPRVLINGPVTFTVYQPQVQAWDGHTLSARNAVSVQTAGQPQAVFGVITVKATTAVDKATRRVDINNVQILSADFPSAPTQAQEYLDRLRETFPQQFKAISLDRLQTSLAAHQEQQKANVQPLDNTPPQIIFATRPSILVNIDGTPVYRPVAGTGLERVLNTRVLLLKDNQNDRLYLHVLSGYLSAPGLDGPWAVTAPPPGAATAENQARSSHDVDLLEGLSATNTVLTATGTTAPTPAPQLTPNTAPDIFISTGPAELITFDGHPNFVPIPGTQLLYATNTTGNVFRLLTDQQYYVLLSGRWFWAPSLQGSWQFVPGQQLPADFAHIPDANPKENVKASIPGTPQAQEAFIENSIPQSTRVSRSTPMQPPRIDGQPQLASIAGTPLQYVVNSDTPILQVNDQSWYACQNGIWFMANSLSGPWHVADTVPSVIYSIPPDSPLHYVTYVRIYDAGPDYVDEGYTPGYLGTVVAPDNTVVYGTGYEYPPWVGTDWYAEPVTWGLGSDLAWTPWYGWGFGFGFGWFWGVPFHHHHHWACHPPAPWWGPYRHWAHQSWGRMSAWGPGGWAHTSVNLYHPSQPAGVAFRTFGVNPWSGVYGSAYNSRTGRLQAGQQARVQNVFHPPAGAALAPTGRNNAFAMPNGGVYVRDGHGPGGWHSVTPGAPSPIPPSTLSGLGRENAARGLGEQHFNSFQSTVPSGGFHPGTASPAAGGFHGGATGGGGGNLGGHGMGGGAGGGHGGGGGGGHR